MYIHIYIYICIHTYTYVTANISSEYIARLQVMVYDVFRPAEFDSCPKVGAGGVLCGPYLRRQSGWIALFFSANTPRACSGEIVI